MSVRPPLEQVVDHCTYIINQVDSGKAQLSGNLKVLLLDKSGKQFYPAMAGHFHAVIDLEDVRDLLNALDHDFEVKT